MEVLRIVADLLLRLRVESRHHLGRGQGSLTRRRLIVGTCPARFITAIAVVFLGCPFGASAQFHEPIFGVGPRTIWKNGIGFEIGLDRDKSKREESWGLEFEAGYGITANWAILTRVQQIVDQAFDESGIPTTGLGDLMISSKNRFYRKFVKGGLYHAAVLGGVELPTGAVGLSSESTDIFGGLAAG